MQNEYAIFCSLIALQLPEELRYVQTNLRCSSMSESTEKLNDIASFTKGARYNLETHMVIRKTNQDILQSPAHEVLMYGNQQPSHRSD